MWSKKIKAFTNATLDGIRVALEWAERETEPITGTYIEHYDWEPAEIANGRIYDMLVI